MSEYPKRFVHPRRPGEVRTAYTPSDEVRLRFDAWRTEPADTTTPAEPEPATPDPESES